MNETTDTKPRPSVSVAYSETIKKLGWPLLRCRTGSLARGYSELAAELQMMRQKCGLPLLAAEDDAGRLARWLREYPLTPGAATATAAPKPASTSATPTWDKFQTLPEREKTAFWTQHREQLNAEQRAAGKAGVK